MQPGALFSVGVPDTEWPLQSYVSGAEEYFNYVRHYWHPEWCTTRMYNLNYHFRQGREHKYAYDYETLAQILHESGFISISKRPFNPAMDAAQREQGTLYVDASKPVIAGNLTSR